MFFWNISESSGVREPNPLTCSNLNNKLLAGDFIEINCRKLTLFLNYLNCSGV